MIGMPTVYKISDTPTYGVAHSLSASLGHLSSSYTTEYFLHQPGICIHLPHAMLPYSVVAGIFIPSRCGIWLNWFGVSPSLRREGHGSALVKFLQALYPTIALNVRATNRSARMFYHTLGFDITTQYGYMPHFYQMVWRNKE